MFKTQNTYAEIGCGNATKICKASSNDTERFTDLGKLICLWWSDFRPKPIIATDPAASKNDTHFKSGQNQLENNHLASLI